MKRIEFFKQMLLAGGFLFIPKPSSENEPKETSEIRLCCPYIAGFQYYKGADIEHFLKENDHLSLKRQAQNPHDCYAIEVYREGAKLGYLPRKENKIVARMMDQGINVKARIIKIDQEAHPYRRVKVKVFYEVG